MSILRRTGDDGAVGWISTADYLFLIVVFVLAIAVRLKNENDGFRREQLVQRREYEEIKSERDDLREKLRTELIRFEKAIESLTASVNELAEQKERLRKELTALQAIHAGCDAGLIARLKDELKMREEEVKSLEAVRKRLVSENDELSRDVARLSDDLKKANKTMAEAAAGLIAAKKRLRELESEVGTLMVQRTELQGMVALFTAENKKLMDQVEVLRRNDVGRYFVGLHPEDRRVLFVVDHSGSMAEPVLNSGALASVQNRWQDVRQAIDAWITRIPSIDQAALILFSDRVRAFPSDYSLIKMGDQKSILSDTRGRELREELGKVVPGGGTNMVEAIDLALSAYSGTVDAVILFTDGRPTSEGESVKGSSSELCERILGNVDRAIERGAIPRIHVVALGDYFDKDFGKFLMTLATKTKGSFRGW